LKQLLAPKEEEGAEYAEGAVTAFISQYFGV